MSLSRSLSGATAASKEPDLWMPGDVLFGKLEILGVVGKGGMGSVYRVHHWEWDRELAVKVPHPRLQQDADAKDRWVVEAETWIELGVHPNIVQCWFVREWSNIPLLFLSYLPGGNLGDWMDANPERGWDVVLDYALQACDGLIYAHSHGLIHRDVKPANLLLDGEGRLLVTDFGLVKRASQPDGPMGAAAGPVMDDTGMMGTPSHAPPEQWTGQPTGPPADVYSLGIVLYELATGCLPFEPICRATALHDLLNGHLNKTPKDPRTHREDVPEGLALAILGCLRKKPEERLTLMELREELSRLVGSGRSLPQASPQRADALNNKAVSLCYLGKVKEAFTTWNQAAQLDPLHAESVYNRACLQWRSGQIDLAEARRRLGQVQADRPWAGAYTAYLHLESGLPKLAERDLREALQHSEIKGDGAAWRALGDALMCQARFPEADQAYREAQERSPADRDVQVRLALAQSGERGQAGAIYFPRPEPVQRLQLPTRVLGLRLAERRLFVRHQFGVECVDLTTGVTAWSGRTDEVEEGLFLSPSFAASGRDCWALKTGTGTRFSSSERVVASFPLTDRVLATSQGLLHILTLPDGKVQRGLRGSEGQILAACVASDELHALTGSSDRRARLWDLRTGACLAELVGHKDYVQAVAFTADGRLALTGGRDAVVRVWSLPQGERQGALEQKGEVTELALTGDGQHLVVNLVADGRRWVSVWDLPARSCLFTRPGQARVLPGSPWLVASGHGPEMELWALPTGRVVRTFGPLERVPEHFGGADGGVWVAAACGSTVEVWEADEDHRALERSLIVTRVRGHREGEEARRRFTTGLEESRRLLAAAQPAAAYRLLLEARSVRGYDRDPEALDVLGSLLGHLPRGRLHGAWEVRAWREASGERIEGALLTGTHAVSRSGRTARLWDLETGICLRGFAGHKKAVTCMALGPDGELLTGSLDGTVRVWDVETGEQRGVLGPHESGVLAVHMHRDRVLTVTSAGQVRMFQPGADKPQVLAMLPEDSEVSFAPDGSWLAFVAGDKVAALPLTDRARPVTLREGSGWPVMLGPGKLMFASRVGSLELVNKGKAAGRLETDPVAGLSTTQDRTVAVTLGADLLRLWRSEPLEALGQLALGRATAAGLSANARFLLVGYADGSMQYWELDWELIPPPPQKGLLARLWRLVRPG